MEVIKDQKSIYGKVSLYIKKNQLIESGDVVYLALSGGADSIALSEILLDLRKKIKFTLKACHFNHNIRGEAGDADELFVQKYCQKNNVHLEIGRQPANQKLKSEEDAREARYHFFEKIVDRQGSEGAKIATAHHLDDLAETYLMRLIRGSGLKGLSSILPQRKNYIRPLLSISKLEILNFLRGHQIPYCQDLSNFDDKFTRNRIRSKLIPLLLSYNPQVMSAIVQNAQIIGQENDFIDIYSKELFEILVEQADGAFSWDASAFHDLHPSLRRRLVILCIEKLGGRDYTFEQIENIIQLTEQNVGKKELPLPHSLRFRLESGRIYISAENTE